MLRNLPLRITLSSALIFNLAASPAMLNGQQAPADVPSITIRSNTRLVTVDVVVTDKKGQPVAGLKPENFTLEENGKRQKISIFVPIGTFAFFGLHTLVWLVRAVYLYLHDSKKFREAKIQTQVDGEWFTRFVPFERFLHFLVVTSFLLLVITGMPLKFYYTHWAKVIFAILGGPETARTLHRFAALITFLYFG